MQVLISHGTLFLEFPEGVSIHFSIPEIRQFMPPTIIAVNNISRIFKFGFVDFRGEKHTL